MIDERIRALRSKMKERAIEAYIIPMSDPHSSEYLSEYYKEVEFISGFSGSNGTVVITMNKAALWTDGRYFIQGEKELRSTEFELYRLGTQDDTIVEFINKEVSDFGKIGVNGETCSYDLYTKLIENIDMKVLVTTVDFIGEIWKNRPSKPKGKVHLLDEFQTGLSSAKKLKQVQKYMMNKEIDYYFLGALEDIAYLYNIRGEDIEYVPVVLAYSLITQEKATIYLESSKCSSSVIDYFQSLGVEIKEYHGIFDDLPKLPGKSTLLFDPEKTNIQVYQALNRNVRFQKEMNITSFMKAIKNEKEIANIEESLRLESIALLKYFSWLEEGIPTGNVTESSGANRLEDFRKEFQGYDGPSFETISAYGKNAALPHYVPVSGSVATLREESFYLLDAGGQYEKGTTDLTRTLALGSLTEEEKKDYTLVLKAHIALMTAKFKQGTVGSSLDAIARQTLWKEGLDYNHGTGHGIGYLLSCHEGPQSISPKNTKIEIEEGMILSNEPGLYKEGRHGIRIENMMVCELFEETEFGRFYEFRCLSFFPIDTKPLIKSLLTPEEIQWINNYHEKCYEILSQTFTGKNLFYLQEVTKRI